VRDQKYSSWLASRSLAGKPMPGFGSQQAFVSREQRSNVKNHEYQANNRKAAKTHVAKGSSRRSRQ